MQSPHTFTAEGYPELGLFIDGEWLRADRRDTLAVHNPASGALLGELPIATTADLDRCLDSSQRAFVDWRSKTAIERARVMMAIACAIREDQHALARIVTLEQGKCLRESLQEIQNTADTFEWMAEEGKRAYGRVVPSRVPNADQFVRVEPVGPVAAFSPWNFPAVLACRKVATAIAAGCTVIIKPAEETPGIMLAIARICQQAGLPDGVLNVVYGDPPSISEHLIDSPIIQKISFTGSVPVGQRLAAQAGAALKKMTLELGGHSPVIVMDDVDVERVAKMAVAAKFRNAGQLCLCPTRFFLHDAIHDRFVESFSQRASELRVGNGLDESVQMGPLANARRVEAMRELCSDAEARGARVRMVSAAAERPAHGHFWSPTVLSELPDDAAAMTREPFGPLALMTRFERLDDALARANAVEYGLAAYAFTKSLDAAREIEHALQAGNVSVNTFFVSPPEMPFSGVKHSGLGHEMGSEGLLDHMNVKAVIRASA